jgi:DNA-binding Lrp family transcriptional regulator
LESNVLDEFDRKLLATLQVDSSLSVQEVADRVGLSSTPCWRRIQKLESLGYIRGRVALLNADKLNVGVSVFIAVKTNQCRVGATIQEDRDQLSGSRGFLSVERRCRLSNPRRGARYPRLRRTLPATDRKD